jgi:hypothetical protein
VSAQEILEDLRRLLDHLDERLAVDTLKTDDRLLTSRAFTNVGCACEALDELTRGAWPERAVDDGWGYVDDCLAGVLEDLGELSDPRPLAELRKQGRAP